MISILSSANLAIFFKSPQKIIHRQAFSGSPSGVAVNVYEYYDAANVSFDIKKTESIISPFSAILGLDVTSRSNQSCGNISSEYDNTKYGWDAEKEAFEKSESSKCYEPQYSNLRKEFVLPHTERIRFNFAYQNNAWIIKSVDRVQTEFKGKLISLHGPELAISGALGLYTKPVQPVTSKEAIEFNAKWLALIK